MKKPDDRLSQRGLLLLLLGCLVALVAAWLVPDLALLLTR
jgi:hypothetical protein